MKITLIAAMTDEKVIGLNNAMPWHLPEDFKHFKLRTLGKTLIMGSNTYRSIGKPLPGRSTIVLSSTLHLDDLVQQSSTENTQYQQLLEQGYFVEVARSLEEALERASCQQTQTQTQTQQLNEVMIAGGGHVYKQSLAFATHMNLTFIHTKIAGDTFFPDWNEKEWEIIHKEQHKQLKAPHTSYSFIDYRALNPQAF